MSIPMAPSSEIFIDDILKKSLIFKEKRLDLIGRNLFMVYVISKDDKPLMPCSNVIARLLLKQGKAKVKRREPFTVK